MYSYPNRIPLPISQVGVIREKFRRLDFDEIYGFYSYQNVTENAGELLDSSLGRYYRILSQIEKKLTTTMYISH